MMKSRSTPHGILVVLLLLVNAAPVLGQEEVAAELDSFQEVPSVIGPGSGDFVAEISEDRTEIDYVLSYGNTRGTVLQAHIHVGQAGANGGVAVFLCTNLGNGPAGTPACPESGEVAGTLTADDVVGGAASQGVGDAAFGFQRLIRAIRNGVTYVNVHSSQFPPGELRGQVELEDDDGE